MTARDDDPHSIEALRAQTLRHLGRRLFEEARAQTEAEDAELESWKREHRDRQRWWSRGDDYPGAADRSRDGDKE